MLVSIHARAWRATHGSRHTTSFWRFQFTPARGGRLKKKLPPVSGSCFNSRPRVAGDGPWRAGRGHARSFNSRPRVAGDSATSGDADESMRFNSRPRVAGDAGCTIPACNGAMFQFTPARGGRQSVPVPFANPCVVSIHARAWRATQPACASTPRRWFQFTPARGGRRKPGLILGAHHRFQFTPARGGRRQVPWARKENQSVSIHARAWRATGGWSSAANPARFQFTPARGGRLDNGYVYLIRDGVSIHARAWRATPPDAWLCAPKSVSIHARAWRATRAGAGPDTSRRFQFTPARGGRLGFRLSNTGFSLFQFTPARGGRPTRR